MNTVWVVEQGDYSDYRVVGIYSSRENAQRIADLINSAEDYCFDDATVSERNLDPCIEDLNAGRKPFNIVMDYSGNTESVGECEFFEYDTYRKLHVWKRTEASAYKDRNINDAISGIVWAADEKHAVKIANEFRARMIAENKIKAH